MTSVFNAEPAAFTTACASVRTANLRAELNAKEITPPAKIAPHAIALGAGVNISGKGIRGQNADIDTPQGAGRLILLHDPQMASDWGAQFRFVCYAQADIELDIGTDDLLSDVAWSWLVDALHTKDAAYSAMAGTATKTLSKGYGKLAAHGDGAQLQVRASWTPTNSEFAKHVEAWSEFLCLMAGLPHTEGTLSFDSHTRKPTGR